MDYACAKFRDFSFSRFGFIMRTDRHRITDVDDRYTDATTVLFCLLLLWSTVKNHFCLQMFETNGERKSREKTKYRFTWKMAVKTVRACVCLFVCGQCGLALCAW